MFETLEIFRMAHAMARHAGARQAVVARNMAHADTPGYKAQDIEPFRDVYQRQTGTDGPFATRPGHLIGGDTIGDIASVRDRTAVSDPNGNSVSLEAEMVRAVEVRRQHDQALAIYRSSLNMLRAAIGRR